MIILLSPSKKLNESPKHMERSLQHPIFEKEALELATIMKAKSSEELEKLLKISPALADLNQGRYKAFSKTVTEANSHQAVFTFAGTVYDGLGAETLSEEEVLFANAHLRHISGVYGLLRPLDAIQPYRLDMGTRLENPRGKNLYQFWGDRVTEQLNAELRESGSELVINLASNEYSKVLKPKGINGRMLTLNFKEKRDGNYKAIMSFVKHARGAMARYLIQKQVKDIDAIKDFSEDKYRFNESLSDEGTWIFSR